MSGGEDARDEGRDALYLGMLAPDSKKGHHTKHHEVDSPRPDRNWSAALRRLISHSGPWRRNLRPSDGATRTPKTASAQRQEP